MILSRLKRAPPASQTSLRMFSQLETNYLTSIHWSKLLVPILLRLQRPGLTVQYLIMKFFLMDTLFLEEIVWVDLEGVFSSHVEMTLCASGGVTWN